MTGVLDSMTTPTEKAVPDDSVGSSMHMYIAILSPSFPRAHLFHYLGRETKLAAACTLVDPLSIALTAFHGGVILAHSPIYIPHF